MLSKAEEVARAAHDGQTRADSSAYIEHVEAVVAGVEGVQAKTVAWLHDVVEDTSTTLEDLQRAGFDEDIVQAVDVLTKVPGEHYLESYIARVCNNPLAVWVKIADIQHNYDHPKPFDHTNPQLRANHELKQSKYLAALEILKRALPDGEDTGIMAA